MKTILAVAYILTTALFISYNSDTIVTSVKAAVNGENGLYKSWGLDSLDAENLDNISNDYFKADHTGEGVTVYIIDGGIGETESTSTPLYSKDFTSEAAPFESKCYNHGTMMGSAISGKTTGVAKNATIVDLKAITCVEENSQGSYAYDALKWIADNHDGSPAIVNMSLSIDGEYPEMETIVEVLKQKNIPVFAAAANNSNDACLTVLPRIESVITVGGYKHEGGKIQLSDVSSYGSCVDILAPAQGVNAVNAEGKGVYASGTSMATAYASGVAALYLEENPNSTVDELKNWLYSNSLHYSVKEDTTDKILHIPTGY